MVLKDGQMISPWYVFCGKSFAPVMLQHNFAPHNLQSKEELISASNFDTLTEAKTPIV